MNNNFSLSSLSPFNNTLSSYVAYTLLLVLIVSSAYVILKAIKASQQIKWLSKLLKHKNINTIATQRNSITEKARKRNDHISHQWLEFDETLVEIGRGDNTRLYNTLDSAHFFNNSTIGGGLSGNRLLAAIPGVLTAIGVIGTFAGLQVSLSSLHIAGDVSIEEMKQSVSNVIDGAKIAFSTSLFGVSCSVLFNCIEKYIEQNLRNQIAKLQENIDKTFPRLSIENQLQDIAISNKQSQKILQGLAEQIGQRMQESIQTAMISTVKQLVNNTQTSNSETLEVLLREQREAMNKSTQALTNSMAKTTDIFSQSAKFQAGQTQQINEVFGNMGAGLKRFTEGLDSQSKQRDAALATSLQKQNVATTALVSDSLKKIGGTLQDFMEKLALQSDEQSTILKHFINDLRQQSDANNQREAERNDALSNVFAKQNAVVSEKTGELITKFAGAFTGMEILLKQGTELQLLARESEGKQREIIQGMEAAANQLKESSVHIQNSGETLASAGNNLGQMITQATATTQDLIKENQLTANRLEEYRKSLNENVQQFLESGNNVNKKMQEMLDSVKQNQTDFLDDLSSRVEELDKSMKQSLEDYAEQANGQTASHLKVWTESVNDYHAKMNNAVQALANVVDEIQGKIGE